MCNDAWIFDLMHDLSALLLADYMMLWVLVDAADYNPQGSAEDENFWTRSSDGNYSA
jgi:hypothetical protein